MTAGTVSGLLNDEGSGFALFVHVAQARQRLLSGADALTAGLCGHYTDFRRENRVKNSRRKPCVRRWGKGSKCKRDEKAERLSPSEVASTLLSLICQVAIPLTYLVCACKLVSWRTSIAIHSRFPTRFDRFHPWFLAAG